MKVPFKSYLLYSISKEDSTYSYKEILPLMLKEYPNERQITKKNVNSHLESLRVVGALNIVDALEEDSELIMVYQITHYGQSLLKYVKIKENEYGE